jgi:hypothetical protein
MNLYDVGTKRMIQVHPDRRLEVLFLAAVSQAAFFATHYFVPIVKEYMLRRGIFGRDINKDGRTKMYTFPVHARLFGPIGC